MTLHLERLKAAVGWTPRSVERSIWLVAQTPEKQLAAEQVATAISGRFGRLSFALTIADGQSSPSVPSVMVVPSPLPYGPALDLAMRRLRARAVVFIGGDNPFSRRLARAAPNMGVTVLSWDGEGAVPDVLLEGIQRAAKQNPRNLRVTSLGERVALRAVEGGLPCHMERLRLRKLPDLASLHLVLGRPETILCLGSGPSSNDAAAVEAARNADVIFRVKHRWLKEGLVRRADVSFSGTPETAHRLPGAIILVQDHKAAVRLALERSWRGGFRRFSYGIVEDLAPNYRSTTPDGAKMTNGAAMLATAVALRPKRLIVAGVDL